jgi:Flp pilus assembly protein TadB
VDPLAWVVAHGGLYGALAEAAVVVAVAVPVGLLWWRERRRRARGETRRAAMRE